MKIHDTVKHNIFGFGEIVKINSDVAQVRFGNSFRLIGLLHLTLVSDYRNGGIDKTRLLSLLALVDIRIIELQSKRKDCVLFIGKSNILAIYKQYKLLIHEYLLKSDNLTISDYKRLYMSINRLLGLGF